MRVLYVEDHRDSAEIVKVLLERHGCIVELVSTAMEAKAICAERVFDLWIIDIGLPDGHGGNLLRTLRRMDDNARAVALTGFGMPTDVQEGKDDGFEEYLIKPVMVDDLLGMMDRMRAANGHLVANSAETVG